MLDAGDVGVVDVICFSRRCCYVPRRLLRVVGDVGTNTERSKCEVRVCDSVFKKRLIARRERLRATSSHMATHRATRVTISEFTSEFDGLK